jgi:hypothetical protein
VSSNSGLSEWFAYLGNTFDFHEAMRSENMARTCTADRLSLKSRMAPVSEIGMIA